MKRAELQIRRVIVTRLGRRGRGVVDDPHRVVEEWWDAETGEFLFEREQLLRDEMQIREKIAELRKDGYTSSLHGHPRNHFVAGVLAALEWTACFKTADDLWEKLDTLSSFLSDEHLKDAEAAAAFGSINAAKPPCSSSD